MDVGFFAYGPVLSDKCSESQTADNFQSATFLTREEFSSILVNHGVDRDTAISIYWDVKNAAHL